MIRCPMSKISNLFKALCYCGAMTYADISNAIPAMIPNIVSEKISTIRYTPLTEADLLYEFIMPAKIIAEKCAKTPLQYRAIFYTLNGLTALAPFIILKIILKKQESNANGNLLIGLTVSTFTAGFMLRNMCKNAYARYVGNILILTSILLSSQSLDPLLQHMKFKGTRTRSLPWSNT